MDKQTKLIVTLCCSAKSRKMEAAYSPDKPSQTAPGQKAPVSILRLGVVVVQVKQGTAGTGPEVSTVLINNPPFPKASLL
jgi:hypothetical protein